MKRWNIDVIAIQPGAFETSFGSTAVKTRLENLGEAKSSSRDGKDGEDIVAVYQACVDKTAARSIARDDVNKVIDVIEDSLLDSAPLTRYRVGADSVFGVPLLTVMPDKLKDMLLGRDFA